MPREERHGAGRALPLSPSRPRSNIRESVIPPSTTAILARLDREVSYFRIYFVISLSCARKRAVCIIHESSVGGGTKRRDGGRDSFDLRKANSYGSARRRIQRNFFLIAILRVCREKKRKERKKAGIPYLVSHDNRAQRDRTYAEFLSLSTCVKLYASHNNKCRISERSKDGRFASRRKPLRHSTLAAEVGRSPRNDLRYRPRVRPFRVLRRLRRHNAIARACRPAISLPSINDLQRLLRHRPEYIGGKPGTAKLLRLGKRFVERYEGDASRAVCGNL